MGGYDSRISLTDLRSGRVEHVFSNRAQVNAAVGAPDYRSALFALDNTAFVLQGPYDDYLIRIDLQMKAIVGTLRITDFLHGSSLSPGGSRLMLHIGRSDHERIRLFGSKTLAEIEFPKQRR
ncbi:MAG: hypothetical protein ACI9MB_005353 [Verrucomicrobiales bacterium]|jgi:hypothetical protein